MEGTQSFTHHCQRLKASGAAGSPALRLSRQFSLTTGRELLPRKPNCTKGPSTVRNGFKHSEVVERLELSVLICGNKNKNKHCNYIIYKTHQP